MTPLGAYVGAFITEGLATFPSGMATVKRYPSGEVVCSIETQLVTREYRKSKATPEKLIDALRVPETAGASDGKACALELLGAIESDLEP
jgi:hypothetical protein